MFILIPDFYGRITEQCNNPLGILSLITSRHPETVVVPVLNGGDVTKLRAIAIANHGNQVMPIVCKDNTRCLVGALLAGYEAILLREPDAVIVRLDTAEHDINYIDALAILAVNSNGMTIGELDFTNGHLKSGSYDQWTHTNVFPTMYEAMTNGKLRLSCAHGFQAFAQGKTEPCLKIAKQIVEKVEQMTNNPLTWGFDAAMAIGAIASGTPVEISRIPAESNRDRSAEKIDAQLTAHLILLKAVSLLNLV